VNPFSSLSDEELMLKYKAGEFMAFEVLYARHRSTVYTYLSKRIGNDMRDDIFQKIFLKLHDQREKYGTHYTFKKWLYVISKSVLLDHLKSPANKRTHASFNEEIHGESTLLENDLLNDLENIEGLSLKEKEVVTRRILHDEEFETISKSLNTSASNTRKILSRALGKLRERFESEGQSK